MTDIVCKLLKYRKSEGPEMKIIKNDTEKFYS